MYFSSFLPFSLRSNSSEYRTWTLIIGFPSPRSENKIRSCRLFSQSFTSNTHYMDNLIVAVVSVFVVVVVVVKIGCVMIRIHKNAPCFTAYRVVYISMSQEYIHITHWCAFQTENERFISNGGRGTMHTPI